MFSDLHRAVTQCIDLKTTPLDLGDDFSFPVEITHDLNTFVGNNKGDQLIVNRGVFDQRAIGAECSLKFCNREEFLVLFPLLSGRAAISCGWGVTF